MLTDALDGSEARARRFLAKGIKNGTVRYVGKFPRTNIVGDKTVVPHYKFIEEQTKD